MNQAKCIVSHVASEKLSSDEFPGPLILDEEHLNHYTLGDEALAIEILQLFTAQVDIYLDGLRTAKDGIDWQQVAHGLKGSARAIGAWALADLAEKAEHGLLSDVKDTRQEYLPGLVNQVESTKTQIQAILLKCEVA